MMKLGKDASLFGWKPEATALTTASGCDAALAILGQQRTLVNQTMQQRSLTERQPYAEELARLAALRRTLLERRNFLSDVLSGQKERFDAAFRRIARALLDEDTYRRLCDAANEQIDAYDAQPSTAKGPVLEPRSTGGGMRERSAS